MATFGDLQPDHYFLIQEQENASVELVYVPLITEKCVLVEYQDEDQTLSWFRKTEDLFEIVEQLTEEQAVIYESLFEEDEDEDGDWMNIIDDDDDDDDEFWDASDDEEEDDDNQEKGDDSFTVSKN